MRHALILVALTLVCGLAVAAEPSASAKMVTISLDADLIMFVKTAILVGGIFLTIYALIGTMFFGWDVRKARASLNEAEKEVREQLKEVRQGFRETKELTDKLQELGAKLQEDMEALATAGESKAELAAGPSPPAAATSPSVSRTDRDLIREVIASSNYEWTTIGRIMKKTGLSREDILRETRADPDIVIGYGRQTQDHLFKFKHAS